MNNPGHTHEDLRECATLASAAYRMQHFVAVQKAKRKLDQRFDFVVAKYEALKQAANQRAALAEAQALNECTVVYNCEMAGRYELSTPPEEDDFIVRDIWEKEAEEHAGSIRAAQVAYTLTARAIKKTLILELEAAEDSYAQGVISAQEEYAAARLQRLEALRAYCDAACRNSNLASAAACSSGSFVA